MLYFFHPFFVILGWCGKMVIDYYFFHQLSTSFPQFYQRVQKVQEYACLLP